jgi:Mor family transcriptional regulator
MPRGRSKGSTSKLVQLKQAAILREYNEGTPIKAIAWIYGVHESYIYALTLREGVSKRNSRHNNPDILKCYRDGIPIATISSEYGLSVSSIYRILTRHGAKLNRLVSKYNIPAIVKSYRDGVPMKIISCEYGLSLPSIYKVLKREVPRWRYRR